MGGDHDLVVALPDDLDFSGNDHEEVRRLASGAVEHLPCLHRDLRTVPRNLTHGRRVEPGPCHVRADRTAQVRLNLLAGRILLIGHSEIMPSPAGDLLH